MAQDIEKLVLSIEANTKQLERSMKKVENTVNGSMKKSASHAKKFNTALAASQRHMALFLKTMAGAVAIGSLAQLPGVIGDLVSQTGDIGKVADKVGLTTQSLQELRFAAELAGLSTGQLDTGMQRFARRLAEAANGSGELLGILKANNVALRNADGSMRSQNELLDDYADLIKNAGSEQEQLLLAFKGFDTEGAAMVNVLRDGSAGLRAFRQEAHDAGGVIEEDLIREMEELDDRFQRLARTIGIKLKTAVLETVSAFSDMSESLKSYDERTTAQLEEKLTELRQLYEETKGGHPYGVSNTLAQIEEIEQALAGRIEQAKELQGIITGTGGGVAVPPVKPGGGGSGNRSTIIPTTGSSDGGQEAKIQRVIEGLKRQTLAMTESSEAQRVNNALAQAGVGIKSAAGQEIAALAQQYDALVASQMKMNDAMSLAETHGMTLFDSLTDGAKEFDETVQDIAKNILRMTVQSSLFGTGGLANLMGTSEASGGSGGLISSLLGSVFPEFGGARAGGGGVQSGKAYLVGEKGPELMVPGASGTVIPNMNLTPPDIGSLNQGSAMHITLGVSVDESGSLKPFVEAVSGNVAVSVVQQAAPTIISKSVQSSGSALGGGGFDKAMSRFGGTPKAIKR